MISIYLDLNVISQIKNGHHPKLKAILDSERFFIPYSTAHVGDLLSGFEDEQEKREFVYSDLNFISQLTKNYCLCNDGKTIKLEHLIPKELFETRLSEKDLFRNFSHTDSSITTHTTLTIKL